MRGLFPETKEEKAICEYWREIGVNHSKTAPETDSRLKKLECAMYGDPDIADDIGVQPMVKEIYDWLKGSRFTAKAILYIFGGISVIAGGVYAVIKMIKDIAK